MKINFFTDGIRHDFMETDFVPSVGDIVLLYGEEWRVLGRVYDRLYPDEIRIDIKKI